MGPKKAGRKPRPFQQRPTKRISTQINEQKGFEPVICSCSLHGKNLPPHTIRNEVDLGIHQSWIQQHDSRRLAAPGVSNSTSDNINANTRQNEPMLGIAEDGIDIELSVFTKKDQKTYNSSRALDSRGAGQPNEVGAKPQMVTATGRSSFPERAETSGFDSSHECQLWLSHF